MMSRRLKRSRLAIVLFGSLIAAATIASSTITVAHAARPDGDEKNAKTAKAIEDLGESPLAAVFASMTPEAKAFAQHNITLSNPFFEGRFPGSNGNKAAAAYVEFYFKKAGLKPAFAQSAKAADNTEVSTANATYRQPFQQGSETKVTKAVVTLHPSGKEDMKLVEGTDFTVLGRSGSGDFKGQVTFCGYAIGSGPDDYSGFPNNEKLTDRVALVLRYEPMNEEGRSLWAKEGWSPAASLDAKIEEVAKRGPKAIIIASPPGVSDPRSKTLLDMASTRGPSVAMPVIMITSAAADRLGSALGSLDVLRGRVDEAGIVMDVENTRATVNIQIDREPIMTDNVGGVLPGKGALADQYIVIGAHYDHVGFGPVGAQPQNVGKLHPGADDNASGTCGVLVLADKMAKAYAELPEGASARSVLFLTFTAEESGLIGSRYFVNHPSIDLSKVYLMLNMDMIGRLRIASETEKTHGLEVQGTESAEGLYDWLKPILDKSGIEILHGMEVASNSDHFSFYSKNIPSLFLFTGLHRQYHTPQDTFDTINQIGAGKVINLAYDIAIGLAQRDGSLTFKSKKADKPEHAVAPGPTRGKVRFGIAPASYSDDKPGVEVGDVYEGTSAADAGIKIGDRLMKWNGKPITDVESWMPLLSGHKVGDVVEVTLTRDGKEMMIPVKLKARSEENK